MTKYVYPTSRTQHARLEYDASLSYLCVLDSKGAESIPIRPISTQAAVVPVWADQVMPVSNRGTQERWFVGSAANEIPIHINLSFEACDSERQEANSQDRKY
jgi:hypothetical protein